MESDQKTIREIEQEVGIGLEGCRYGADISSYLDNKPLVYDDDIY